MTQVQRPGPHMAVFWPPPMCVCEHTHGHTNKKKFHTILKFDKEANLFEVSRSRNEAFNMGSLKKTNTGESWPGHGIVQILMFHLSSKHRSQIILALCRRCSEHNGGGDTDTTSSLPKSTVCHPVPVSVSSPPISSVRKTVSGPRCVQASPVRALKRANRWPWHLFWQLHGSMGLYANGVHPV